MVVNFHVDRSQQTQSLKEEAFGIREDGKTTAGTSARPAEDDEQSAERSVLRGELRTAGNVSRQQQGVRAEQREQIFRHARHPVLLSGDRSVREEQGESDFVPVHS